MKIKLGIAIVTAGQIKSLTVGCLFRALKDFPHEYQVIIVEGCGINYDRELAVKLAGNLLCSHLLFVDSDMYFDKDAITRVLERDKDIVGVQYNRRTLPLAGTVTFTDKKEVTEGFIQCNAVGTGFMLIKMSVFDRITHPYFFFESDSMGEMTVGEDTWFCNKARLAKCEVWADLSIPIKHIGDYLY